MDKSAYEKLSIRDSAKSLKKYGSTSKHVAKAENYLKHYVTNSDTLQGIALKYDVTIEQIRRVNRLWASDSLFLKEFLLIPISESASTPSTPDVVSPSQITSPVSNCSFDVDEEDISDFLGKIDASIANTKKEVKKTQYNSEFLSSMGCDGIDRKKPKAMAAKVKLNNNGTSDFFSSSSTPQTVVVQQGRKVKSSLKRHERQQAELFEL